MISTIKQEWKSLLIFFSVTCMLISVYVYVFFGPYLYVRYKYANKVLAASGSWNISLPAKSEMDKVLSEHSEIGPHGDALRHSIYVVDRDKIKLKFRIDTNDDIEEICLEYCNKLKTADSYIPDFFAEYRWRKFEKYGDTLILLYFPETNQLHIFEDIP